MGYRGRLSYSEAGVTRNHSSALSLCSSPSALLPPHQLRLEDKGITCQVLRPAKPKNPACIAPTHSLTHSSSAPRDRCRALTCPTSLPPLLPRVIIAISAARLRHFTTAMAPCLLDLPLELRLHILGMTVRLDPILVCEKTINHPDPDISSGLMGLPLPTRGFSANPYLYLYLICSQIGREMAAVKIPGIELCFCCFICMVNYHQTYPSMSGRIKSMQAPLYRALIDTSDDEKWLTEHLVRHGLSWPAKYDVGGTMVVNECEMEVIASARNCQIIFILFDKPFLFVKSSFFCNY